jgi:hypothetical protein
MLLGGYSRPLAKIEEVGEDLQRILAIGVQKEEDHPDRIDSRRGKVARLGPEMGQSLETGRYELARRGLVCPVAVGDSERRLGVQWQQVRERPAAAPHEGVHPLRIFETTR